MREPIYNWVNKQWARMLLALVGFIVVAVLLRNFVLKDNSEAILATTGLIVLWYTLETYRLRWETVQQTKLTRRQTEMAIQPLVLATVENRPLSHDRRAWQVVLRNIGWGPALFVRVDEFAVREDKEQGIRKLSRVAPVDCIEPGKDHALPVENVILVGDEGREFYRNASEGVINFAAKLVPGHANETYQITVRYEDIDRREYWSKVQMGKGGNRLLDHGKESRA